MSYDFTDRELFTRKGRVLWQDARDYKNANEPGDVLRIFHKRIKPMFDAFVEPSLTSAPVLCGKGRRENEIYESTARLFPESALYEETAWMDEYREADRCFRCGCHVNVFTAPTGPRQYDMMCRSCTAAEPSVFASAVERERNRDM